MGTTISGFLVYLGDRLGLFRALKEGGPATAQELAERTDLAERYVHEWLCSQAAGGTVSYDPASKRFFLTEEPCACYADERSPTCFLGAYDLIASLFADESKLLTAFRSGNGVGWHQHDSRLFSGTARFFRPGYEAHLISEWMPALTGVGETLERGGPGVHVGCGYGVTTVLLGKRYPQSQFLGCDYHAPSIQRANDLAREQGVQGNAKFEVSGAKDYPGEGYDLVTFFDCLHDIGDPLGALQHVHNTLAPNGTVMLVEPFARDRLEDNPTPVGRVFYSASTVVCTTASKAQEVGLALGAQAGEARWRELFTEAGFRHFRRAAETPFSLVFEAQL
ncbi:Trans-aconitate 2-methyltransferase [bacterium HR30]|nr:Trans-aconitate 2-methyltransferase [bacterium HR30]